MTIEKSLCTRRHVLAGASAAALGWGLSGCSGGASMPVQIGGTQVDVARVFGGLGSMFDSLDMDEEFEINLGEKLYPILIAKSGGRYKSRRAQVALQEIFVGRIGPGRERALPWDITLLNDDTVNAWALPGGKLAVNKGLLRYVDSEDELAAVIGHEMGHVELSHAIGQMSTEKFTKGFTALGAEAVMSQVDRSGANGLVTEGAIEHLAEPMYELVITGYSRSSEREADSHMVKVCQTTGYDSERGTGFFRTLLELIPQDSERTTSLFSTHPGTLARINAILAEASALPAPAPRVPSPAFAALKEAFPTRRVYKRDANRSA